MPGQDSQSSVRGERSMSQGFVAQYAAEAALSTPGVAMLDSSGVISIKESMGVEHEGKGVQVLFHDDNEGLVTITVFPVVYYGNIMPEVAWKIQERVKADVERYTGLMVEQVNVHIKGIAPPPQEGGRL